MLLRPFLNDATSCASYLFGCGTHAKLAVVDPHADLVDDYLATAAALGAPIVAVFETHVQADHVSGLPALVARTGATAYLPAGAGVEFEHVALADGEVVELGNTLVTAIATPGHAPAHHAYTVADRRRGTEEPWLVFSGDSLLDRRRRPARPARRRRRARPGAAAAREPAAAARAARTTSFSTRATTRARSAAAASPATRSPRSASSAPTTRCSRSTDADAFADALVADMPPPPAEQERIVAANRAGTRGRARMSGHVRLGLRANARQFALLVGLNALVGGMVGLERSVLPLVGKQDFGLSSTSAILAFVVAFGAAKALTNLAAGGLAERVGRKRLLVLGWLVALPVPLLIGLAPSWWFIVAANLLLGINQGLAWSMTVVMKIDLAGPRRRGLALGLNEAAGYLGVAATAFLTGALAASYAPLTVVWVGAALIASAGLLLSVFAVRDTGAQVALEQQAHGADRVRARESRRRVRAGEPARPDPARLQPGRAGQQPQRRARLGPRAALPGSARRERARDRRRRRRLPGRLGRRPAR